MNRLTLIIIGIVILLLISLVWVYLLLFGTPNSSHQVFTNLGFTSTSRPVAVTPPPTTTAPTATSTLPTNTSILKQLTTRPVAGFTFITRGATSSAASNETVRFVERGTGHVYDIDPATKAAVLVSNTTIPAVNEAIFSPDGGTIAFTTYAGYDRKVFVGTIGSNQAITGTSLPTNADNLAFQSNTTVLYTVAHNGTTVGYAQNLTTSTRHVLFSIKFTNITMIWGAGHTTTYLVTRPDAQYQGFVYAVHNGNLTPVTKPAFGLTAFANDQQVVLSYIQNNEYQSAVENRMIASSTPLPILTLPSKCVFAPQNTAYLWCGAPLGSTPSTYLTDWYQGTLHSTDDIWQIGIASGRAVLYADPQKLVQKNLDIEHLSSDSSGGHLLLVNKADQTLWLVTTPTGQQQSATTQTATSSTTH